MNGTRKNLIIAADDYGLSSAVSLGIRELAAKGRITATGAMTLMPAWLREAAALKDLDGKIDIGLHFTLTDQRPLGAMPTLAPDGRLPSIATLLRRSLMRAIPAAEIKVEFDRQLDAFEAAMGRPPDFIDGHQHVHVLAGVRETVLDAFGRRLDPHQCWLRDCTDRPRALLARGGIAKAALISLLAFPLHLAARRRRLTTNRGFSGFYTAKGDDFAKSFARLLAGAEDGHLVMVHPGHLDSELFLLDSLTFSRQTEWEFLAGDGMPDLLANYGFTLTVGSKSWQTPPP